MQDENLTNNELVKLFQQTKDEKYFNRLFNENQGLIQKLVSEHSFIYDKTFSMITKEDAVAVANYAFFQAVRTFDDSKGFAFSTYFSHVCRHEMGHIYVYMKRHEFPIVMMDDKVYVGDEDNETTIGDFLPDPKSEKGFEDVDNKMVGKKALEKVKKILKPAEFYVLKKVLEGNKTIVEIGKECNVTKQRISGLYVSAIRKIHDHKYRLDRFVN